MFQKIKNYQNHPYVKQFSDVRALGLLGFGVLVVLVSWSGVNAIQTNYELQKQISRLQQENQVHQLENNNLKLSNQYLGTNRFLELAARRQFGKAASGEKLILVPKNVALAHTVELPDPGKTEILPLAKAKPKYQQNIEAWVDFFFHHAAN